MTPKRQETAKGGKMTPKRQETAKGGKMTPKRQETAEGGKITPERTSMPLFRYFPKRKRFPRKIVGYAPANHCFFFDFLLYC